MYWTENCGICLQVGEKAAIIFLRLIFMW